jgi:catechol 2,3-dioxygenase-like lactoylglutathione lyase family enzyme
MIKHFDHVTIVVRDVEAAKQFFGLLGFKRDKSVVIVEWLASVPREQAKWRATPKLYSTSHVRASLNGQPETMKFLEEEFKVPIREIIA